MTVKTNQTLFYLQFLVKILHFYKIMMIKIFLSNYNLLIKDFVMFIQIIHLTFLIVNLKIMKKDSKSVLIKIFKKNLNQKI